MLRNIIIEVVCFSALFAASAFANPDSVRVYNGDLRISGAGNGLVFPDGSIQYKAEIQGPVGPQGLKGDTGTTGSQGPAGTNGFNSLILLVDEVSGANCTNGGVKIQTGLDLNRDGALGAGEVTQTKYICNGSAAGSATAAEFPIAATSGREMSRGAAFDGTNYLVGIQGDQNASNSITAQLVSGSTGSLVGSPISIGRTGGMSSVAFDGTNYLMIWPDDALYPNDILYGQRISKTGQLVGSAFIIGQLGTKGRGRIIFDGANYFAVWDTRGSSSDASDIYGQFISPSGSLLGAAISVSTAPHGQREPAVAFDGTNILVVWGDGRNQSACYTDTQGTHCFESDVYGQFVTKSAPSTAGSLTGNNFLINASSLPRDNPLALAFDGTNYFVVIEEETTLPNACQASGCKWDIYGQLVTKSGIPTGSIITISNTSPDHKFQNVIWNGTKYLVTWTENWGTPTTGVKGGYFDTSGAPIGSALNLFSTENNGRQPWFAIPHVNGTKYFMIVNRGVPGTDPFNVNAYTSQDVLGAFITP
ncbi:MAG: hypothetical protein JJE30_11475 [Desulfuromonadales bacterium]|nr:hypothetical protein [Desulfuromonadales bacterium]